MQSGPASVTLLTIPFFIDASSRIIVWRSILGTNGVINNLLVGSGIIRQAADVASLFRFLR